MIPDATSRRSFLAATGAAAATWLAADRLAFSDALAQAAADARSGAPPQLDVLTPEQAADVEAVCAQIVPTDDLPGAREARVIVFIDRSLATFAQNQRQSLLLGLDDLNRRVDQRWPGTGRFAQLDGARQIELLRDLEETPFFEQLRFATIVGCFADPSWGGNYEMAGWRILGYEHRPVWEPPFGWYDREAEQGR